MKRVARLGNDAANLKPTINEDLMTLIEADNLRMHWHTKTNACNEKHDAVSKPAKNGDNAFHERLQPTLELEIL